MYLLICLYLQLKSTISLGAEPQVGPDPAEQGDPGEGHLHHQGRGTATRRVIAFTYIKKNIFDP